MAAELKDHIHLGTSNPPTSDTWELRFEPRHHYTPEIVAKISRALTGKLNVSVLSDTSGPVIIKNQRGLVLIVDSMTDRDTIIGMLGKTCYFVPNYHDDASLSSYVQEVVMLNAALESSDPNQHYWYIAVNLEDAESAATWTP